MSEYQPRGLHCISSDSRFRHLFQETKGVFRFQLGLFQGVPSDMLPSHGEDSALTEALGTWQRSWSEAVAKSPPNTLKFSRSTPWPSWLRHVPGTPEFELLDNTSEWMEPQIGHMCDFLE